MDLKDKLIFDVTDANTILDSDSVGAFLRAGTDGALISSGDGDSDSVANTFEGLDTRAFAFAYDSVGDHWDRLRATNGALHVDIQDASIAVSINSEKAEDAAHSSGDTGSYVLAVRSDVRPTDANTSADGDYASFFVNASGEQYVKDTDAAALLTTIDADTGSIATSATGILADTNALVVDLAAIETELLDQGTVLDSILADTATIDSNLALVLADTNALVVDAAAIEAELLSQGTTLDSILVDTSALVVDAAAIEAELLDQGTVLDTISSTLTGFSKAEDSAHVSGDQGIMGLAVRNDTLAALAGTDGDYAPLQVDADGALYVNIASGTITTSDVALANVAIASAANALTAANTAEDVVASPLANRKYLWIYNNGNRKAYIGASGVSESNGFPVSPGSYMELRAGAAVDIEWVSSNTSQEIRTLELS